jgi:Domain of unknown function (DUF4185)
MAKHIRFYVICPSRAHRRRTANDGRGNLGWLGLLVLCATSNLGAATPDVSYVAGSSQKLEQLIGDTDFQTGQPTLSQTKANYNLANTDLGVSFRHKNQTYIMFGDSNFPGTADAMGYTTDTDPEAGLTLLFLNTGNFTPIQIPGILHGAFDVPIYGVSSAGKMYLYYSTDADANVPIMGRTVVAVSTNDGVSFSAPLYTLSSNRFINVAVIEVNCVDWPGLPQTNGLGLLIFGSGAYRQSDIYLAFQPESSIEDATTIRYMKGLDTNSQPTWSSVEADAERVAPISFIGSGGKVVGVGELSATFKVYLKKWMLFAHLPPQPTGPSAASRFFPA